MAVCQTDDCSGPAYWSAAPDKSTDRGTPILRRSAQFGLRVEDGDGGGVNRDNESWAQTIETLRPPTDTDGGGGSRGRGGGSSMYVCVYVFICIYASKGELVQVE